MSFQEFQSILTSPAYWATNLGAMTGNGVSEFLSQVVKDSINNATVVTPAGRTATLTGIDPLSAMLAGIGVKIGLQMASLYVSTEIPSFGSGAAEAQKFVEGFSIGSFSQIIDDIVWYSAQSQAEVVIDPVTGRTVRNLGIIYTSPIAVFTSAWVKTLMTPVANGALPPAYVPQMLVSRAGGVGAPAMPNAPMRVPGEPVKRLWGAAQP